MENKYDDRIKSLISYNSRAKFEYFLEDIYEAGMVLQGTEVKSLRTSKASLAEAHIAISPEREAFIHNLHIALYKEAGKANHDPKRPKKLLLREKEINKLAGAVQRKGYTLIALKIYFNLKNKCKVVLAVAKGKKDYDKRETIKKRDWIRMKSRIKKENFV